MNNDKILADNVPRNDRIMRQAPEIISGLFAGRKQKTGLTPRNCLSTDNGHVIKD